MGVVYDPERVAAGRIPSAADGQAQKDAAIVLGESLLELTQETRPFGGELVLYMLYGSASEPWNQQVNRRSDVDVLAVVDTISDESKTWRQIDDRISAVENRFDVEVNLSPYRLKTLEGPVRINPFYAGHLSSRRGFITHKCLQYSKRMVFSDPEAMAREAALEKLFYEPPFMEAWPFAKRYIDMRRERFQATLDRREIDLTALKGPFELPRNLGRTINDLFHMYMIEHTDSYDPKIDDLRYPFKRSQSQAENLLAVMAHTGTAAPIQDDLQRLMSLDDQYTSLLEATVEGTVDVKSYRQWLTNIYTEALERAFKITSMAGATVDAVVELAKIDPEYEQVPHLENEELWYPEDRPGCEAEFKAAFEASQIVPVSYDIDSLLFQIAPRYPDIAEHYDLKDPNDLRHLIYRHSITTRW